MHERARPRVPHLVCVRVCVCVARAGSKVCDTHKLCEAVAKHKAAGACVCVGAGVAGLCESAATA